MTDYFYGISDRQDVLASAKRVLDIEELMLPYALELMIETAAAETLLATYEDPTPHGAGASLCQIDKSTFTWLQDAFYRNPMAGDIYNCLGVAIEDIVYDELNNNPDYGFLFCILRYYIEDVTIPDDQAGRAALWKEYFNTSAGKGTVEDYLAKCRSCRTDALLGNDPGE